jgi:hypothetical protein
MHTFPVPALPGNNVIGIRAELRQFLIFSPEKHLHRERGGRSAGSAGTFDRERGYASQVYEA